MSRLLTDNDYLKVIQSDNLDQVISSNDQIKLDMEQAAQSEMISYLKQRYITDEVFTNTQLFSYSATYKGKNLVYLDAAEFSATTVYTTNQMVSRLGFVYYSTAGSAAHNFNASEWTLLGAQYAFFYVSLPNPEYDLETEYAINDIVWYADKVYTCVVANTGIVPGATGSTAYWGTGVAYSITGQWVSDGASDWVSGDNRNQQIVLYLLDITLYHLHSRINPRNVPDIRKERYDGNAPNQLGGAIGWLKKVAGGDINADIPTIKPTTGLSVRYGSANNEDTQSRNYLW